MLQPARPATAASATTPGPADTDGDSLVAETEQRLVARYAVDAGQADTVRGAVAEAYGRLADARIRTFLPILVERSVRLRLAETA